MRTRQRKSSPGPRTRLAVGAIVLALLGTLPGVGSAAGEAPEPAAARKQERSFLYRGVLTAKVTHSLFVDWQDGDSEDRTMETTIQGSLPQVRLTGHDLTDLSILDSSVGVVSAEAKGTTFTNSGQHFETCDASSATIAGRPVLVPRSGTDVNDLLPFSRMKLTGDCRSNEGPNTRVAYDYDGLTAVVGSGVAGDRSITLAFHVERGTAPMKRADECPGYVEGRTPVCEYAIDGTLTLQLVKELPSSEPAPLPQRRPAQLAPGAKRVTTGVRCPAGCSVTIRLTPLRGGPRITAPRRLKAAANRLVKVSIAVPGSRRRAVRKAGGVRMTLTYRIPGRKAAYVETRVARR